MARTASTYTVTRNSEGRLLTTYSDGSFVLDWAPDSRFDSALDHVAN